MVSPREKGSEKIAVVAGALVLHMSVFVFSLSLPPSLPPSLTTETEHTTNPLLIYTKGRATQHTSNVHNTYYRTQHPTYATHNHTTKRRDIELGKLCVCVQVSRRRVLQKLVKEMSASTEERTAQLQAAYRLYEHSTFTPVGTHITIVLCVTIHL